MMTDQAYVTEIAQTLYKRKANAISALNVAGQTIVCDWMVIASGRNVNQVASLAQDVDDRMAELGLQLRRSEGRSEGRWVVLDYGHILVHIFHPDERDFYNLDKLWDNGENRLELSFSDEEQD